MRSDNPGHVVNKTLFTDTYITYIMCMHRRYFLVKPLSSKLVYSWYLVSWCAFTSSERLSFTLGWAEPSVRRTDHQPPHFIWSGPIGPLASTMSPRTCMSSLPLPTYHRRNLHWGILQDNLGLGKQFFDQFWVLVSQVLWLSWVLKTIDRVDTCSKLKGGTSEHIKVFFNSERHTEDYLFLMWPSQFQE